MALCTKLTKKDTAKASAFWWEPCPNFEASRSQLFFQYAAKVSSNFLKQGRVASHRTRWGDETRGQGSSTRAEMCHQMQTLSSALVRLGMSFSRIILHLGCTVFPSQTLSAPFKIFRPQYFIRCYGFDETPCSERKSQPHVLFLICCDALMYPFCPPPFPAP
jgi:hypothetical protein